LEYGNKSFGIKNGIEFDYIQEIPENLKEIMLTKDKNFKNLRNMAI
jgi:hypothetical protein